MSRLDKVTTRMGPDLRACLERLPGLGGIALWVTFGDSDDPARVAFTDGRIVCAGPRYAEYAEAERHFILLHELLHVALAHPLRARELSARREGFDARLYNIACDAIVNAALEPVRGIKAPAGAVKLETLFKSTGLWREGDMTAGVVRRWSSEALYTALADNRQRIANELLDGADDIRLAGSADAGEGTTEKTLRAWNARLLMARGALGGVLHRLAGELPRVRTPWQRILRDLLYRHARRKRVPDPARPTRRWIALEGLMREREGINLPFERGARVLRSGRICVAVDTSGSVDDRVLARFRAEICQVVEQLEPQVRVIVCDAAVHETIDLGGHSAAKLLRQMSFTGGGGTDFRPAIEAATEWRPDLLIYLTDLYGEAGHEPPYPVLWAVPAGHAAPPWGKMIELD